MRLGSWVIFSKTLFRHPTFRTWAKKSTIGGPDMSTDGRTVSAEVSFAAAAIGHHLTNIVSDETNQQL
jgi:hypothetical protein